MVSHIEGWAPRSQRSVFVRESSWWVIARGGYQVHLGVGTKVIGLSNVCMGDRDLHGESQRGVSTKIIGLSNIWLEGVFMVSYSLRCGHTH